MEINVVVEKYKSTEHTYSLTLPVKHNFNHVLTKCMHNFDDVYDSADSTSTEDRPYELQQIK